jgi:eukaryotic-like serine/threonine-protein kinase
VSVGSGTMVAHYRLVDKIGEGGMGAVWRARDTRLDRDVAVKFILPERIADPERRLRFEREAKLLASLNHPNVAAIHGLETYDGAPVLILELVPGESLDERLGRGPMPADAAITIGAQLLDGLGAAHEAGIVHRDLKPANVRVTPDGRVKILDFGLARGPGAPIAAPDGALPTMTATATIVGTVMGTPAYMSPEQARGFPADVRSDLWSFGCIVFEMLTGEIAFAGPTISDTIAAVLTREPALDRLPHDTPQSVRVVLERCFVKDVADRTLTAAEAREAFSERVEPAALSPRLTQQTLGEGIDGFPAWSPDGGELAYAAEVGRVRKIVRTKLGSGEAVPVTRGDADDIMPAWSPDGRTMLFVRARKEGRRLEPGDVYGEYADADVWEVDLESGRETRWAENAFNPAFAHDGAAVAVDSSKAGPRRIWLLDPRGRNPVQASSDVSEAVAHLRPRFSPDGRAIVFQNLERTRFTVKAIDLASRRTVAVTDSPWSDLYPAWSASGRFVYFSSFRSGGLNIWRIPVTPRGEPFGPAQQITNGAGQDVEIAMAPGGGRLAFTLLRQNASLWTLPVTPDSGRPTGPPSRLIATSRDDSRGAFSPDGTKIAFNSVRSGDMSIWLHDRAAGRTRALTSGPGGDYQPFWSPDGSRLAFFSSRKGSPGIWTVEASGGEPVCLSASGGVEINPCFSPDGSHIAYQSDRDGRLEVWVMRSDGTAARQLTRCGVAGHFLRWTLDGTRVIFRCPGASATVRVPLSGGEPEPMGKIAGGAHMSLSPDATKIMDVVGHKVLWVSTVGADGAESIFEFDDPEIRIDYPMWSPDGASVLFDRFKPQGGEIWVLDGID